MQKLKERQKKWTLKQLKIAVVKSTSIRQVLKKLGLIEAGGNYQQIKKYLKIYNINTDHFRGMAWNRGLKGLMRKPIYALDEILIKNSDYQSYKLKNRLFKVGLKSAKCELCGWAKMSVDGRIPIELDHINGNHSDNRLRNLRILCPNCHSLRPNHRARNMGQWRN
ncbi:MAG TPA: HNH endonuclease [Candidatus Paceibacterota bacterium]